MSSTQISETGLAERDYDLPFGRPVLVECEGFRCLAVLDRAEGWKDYYSRESLPGVIEVVAVFD